MSEIVTCASCGKRNRVPLGSDRGTPRCANCHRDLPWIVAATDGDFDDAVRGNVPVLVDLWAPWCGPCRMVAPAVEQAAREFAGRLKVVKVNVDESPRVSAKYAAQSIPLLLILNGGNVAARQIGALPADRLLDWVRRTIGTASAAR